MSLPPLPDKARLCTFMPDDYRYGNVYGYTTKQMHDYARAAVELNRIAAYRAGAESMRERAEKQRDLLGRELNKTRNGLDALGVAISNAGYEWTPEMRKAYEDGTK